MIVPAPIFTFLPNFESPISVSYTHLRAHETPEHLVCRLLVEKKSIIGAGSTITKKVSKNTLAITRAEQIEVKNYKRKK